MKKCPSCSTAIPKGLRECPACGLALHDPAALTQTSNSPGRPTSASGLSHDSINEARFIPGTIVAGRYRIVGLLGKGGMAEVYRANDLKLGQTVALKFLPPALSNDGALLARFHAEVRVARQITHPNVCRVHDIGEVTAEFGRLHYISMEYIDGEDLASLLRRIGRLPVDKGIETARQICAGLAAAHDNGVLHRDLKPANVMHDGRGKARITDFGLAVLTADLRREEVRAGTPAYMAPEQLMGKESTVKSDIYALGLVLYELFTGKCVYEARSINELLKLHERSQPTSPASPIKDLEGPVERVIMRCLDRDPSLRPASALQVAAALTGGDPLAAALAAGETPSPEMVAAARSGERALRPAVAVACLGAVFMVLGFLVLFSSAVMLHRKVPLDKSPEILAERAGEIVRRVGYAQMPTDIDYGFSLDTSYSEYTRQHDSTPDRWSRITSGQPALIYFSHRQSPRYLEKLILGAPTVPDPPLHVSGLRHIALDPRGRLIEFYRVPQQLDAGPGLATQTDWTPMFAAAELEPATFKTAPSKWVPPVADDTRTAWE